MQATVFLVVIASCLVLIGAKLTNVPAGFPICHRDDPQLNACVVKAANHVKPFLIKGVPELGLPSISPFVIPEVVVESGTNALNFKATFSNMTFHGFDTYNFTKFDFDPKMLEFHCQVNFGKLHIASDYQITGKILLAPIAGRGRFYMNVSTSEGFLDEDAKLIEKKGDTYIEPAEVRVKLNFGKTECYFDGLFDGNEELAIATNRVINENSDELVKEITPTIEKVMKEVFYDFMQKSTSRIPYDIIYPLTKTT